MMPPSAPNWAPLAALLVIGLSTTALAANLARRHGVKAIMLSAGDDAHGYLANVFRLSIVAAAAFCIAYAADPMLVGMLGPILPLCVPTIADIGLALMVAGTFLIIAAQLNMGRS